MHKAMMLSLTVMCESQDLVLKANEAMARVQAGLAMEGLHTTLTVSTVEYEDAEVEATEDENT
jgi:hypothetical protein